MRINRRPDGLELHFDRAEGELLAHLLGDTAEAMQPGALDDDDPVRQRLFPVAYREDADAERNFRHITESALREERIERAERCTAEVAAARTSRRGLELVLDGDAVDRWTRAINDVRLALGTRLGITEDDGPEIAEGDADAGSRMAYMWLTAVQDGLVRALTD